MLRSNKINEWLQHFSAICEDIDDNDLVYNWISIYWCDIAVNNLKELMDKWIETTLNSN